MPKFLNDVDINKNQLQNPVIHPSATAPSGPKQGQIYFNTTDNNIYRYDGTRWVTYQNELDTAATGTISIDNTPTSGSSNLVTSGGVYSAIQGSSGSTVFLTGTLSGEQYPLSYISISEKYSDLQSYLADNKTIVIKVATTGDNSTTADFYVEGVYTNEYSGWFATLVNASSVYPTSVGSVRWCASSNTDTSVQFYPIQVSIAKPSSASNGQYLKYNGTNWVAAQAPVTSVNTQTGAVVLDADDIDYDSTYTVKGKIDTIIASGGEPNVIETVKVNGTALTVTNKAVDVPVPVQVESNTTGISIANHSTASIYGVSSSTTSVTGVKADTTTASKVTLGTNISVPNVTSAGSASNWVFENITVPIKNANATSIPNVTAAGSGSFTQGSFSGGSFTQGEDTFTPNTPTVINTTKFNGGSFTQGTDSFTAATHGTDSFTAAKLNTGFYTAGTAASFTRGAFSGGSFTQGTDSFTANTPTAINTSKFSGGSFTRGTFSGGSFTQGTDSFTANVPTKVDTSKFNAGSFTRGSFSGGSGTFTTTVNNHVLEFSHTHTAATHANDSFTAASLATGFYTAGTAASFTQGEDEFTPATHGTDSHTHTPPTLGTAISIPNVTGVSNVTVPIKATSATTVPIKNGTATTVVTSATHSITDNGHNHELSYTSNPM